MRLLRQSAVAPRSSDVDEAPGGSKVDLPVEQGHGGELMVNMKTGKQLRILIPEPSLRRADEVIR
jgi:hypothetical protein